MKASRHNWRERPSAVPKLHFFLLAARLESRAELWLSGLAARLGEVAENSCSLNILEGAHLQARRMSFDLNNGGAESPAPSKHFPVAESFSAACEVVPFPEILVG